MRSSRDNNSTKYFLEYIPNYQNSINQARNNNIWSSTLLETSRIISINSKQLSNNIWKHEAIFKRVLVEVAV